jgi:hypothetical protein
MILREIIQDPSSSSSVIKELVHRTVQIAAKLKLNEVCRARSLTGADLPCAGPWRFAWGRFQASGLESFLEGLFVLRFMVQLTSGKNSGFLRFG